MAPLDDELEVVAVLVFALLLNHPIDLNLHIGPREAQEHLLGPFLMGVKNGWNAKTKKGLQNPWKPF